MRALLLSLLFVAQSVFADCQLPMQGCGFEGAQLPGIEQVGTFQVQQAPFTRQNLEEKLSQGSCDGSCLESRVRSLSGNLATEEAYENYLLQTQNLLFEDYISKMREKILGSFGISLEGRMIAGSDLSSIPNCDTSRATEIQNTCSRKSGMANLLRQGMSKIENDTTQFVDAQDFSSMVNGRLSFLRSNLENSVMGEFRQALRQKNWSQDPTFGPLGRILADPAFLERIRSTCASISAESSNSCVFDQTRFALENRSDFNDHQATQAMESPMARIFFTSLEGIQAYALNYRNSAQLWQSAQSLSESQYQASCNGLIQDLQQLACMEAESYTSQDSQNIYNHISQTFFISEAPTPAENLQRGAILVLMCRRSEASHDTNVIRFASAMGLTIGGYANGHRGTNYARATIPGTLDNFSQTRTVDMPDNPSSPIRVQRPDAEILDEVTPRIRPTQELSILLPPMVDVTFSGNVAVEGIEAPNNVAARTGDLRNALSGDTTPTHPTVSETVALGSVLPNVASTPDEVAVLPLPVVESSESTGSVVASAQQGARRVNNNNMRRRDRELDEDEEDYFSRSRSRRADSRTLEHNEELQRERSRYDELERNYQVVVQRLTNIETARPAASPVVTTSAPAISSATPINTVGAATVGDNFRAPAAIAPATDFAAAEGGVSAARSAGVSARAGAGAQRGASAARSAASRNRITLTARTADGAATELEGEAVMEELQSQLESNPEALVLTSYIDTAAGLVVIERADGDVRIPLASLEESLLSRLRQLLPSRDGNVLALERQAAELEGEMNRSLERRFTLLQLRRAFSEATRENR